LVVEERPRLQSPPTSRIRGIQVHAPPQWYLDGTVLPTVPLWPGFLVDTAFWGGAAFVVWSVRGGAGFVRRGVRRRRGRCVRCGYELKGLAVCPECGGAA
jgi:hypothetical protein